MTQLSIKKINPRFAVLLLFITIAAFFRVISVTKTLSPFINFTPIGAMALFGGCYFNSTAKKYSFPLITLFLSDVVLMKAIYPEFSNGFLYAGWQYTYAAFAVMVFVAKVIKKVSVQSVVIASVIAALAHYIITDFSVWLGGTNILTGKPFTKDWQGLVQCYVLALPYLKNILLGNLLYGGIMFTCFEMLQKRFIILKQPSFSLQ